jgi:hypothetical protein
MVLSLRGKVNIYEAYRDDVGKIFMFVPHLKKAGFCSFTIRRRRNPMEKILEVYLKEIFS